ncbi:MAG: proline racemase family protein [Actinomycetota bacterium]
MTSRRLAVSTVDYHTAGEPFRIVTGGVAPLVGRTILDKRRYARDHLDHVRRLLVYEPRGHTDMYGCFATTPEDGGADLGVVFFHNEGYSTACGHGTIALVTWALDSGLVPKAAPETRVVVDAPSGRLETRATIDGGKVRAVRFTNVPSFVFARGLEVDIGEARLAADVAYGGAFYVSLDAAQLGLEISPGNLGAFIEAARRIKGYMAGNHEVVHPEEPELRDVYGVIFFEDLGSQDGRLRQRNLTVFADGEVDRSPCGSGTSARLALLDEAGTLPRGATLVHEGIAGGTFLGCVSGDARAGGYPAVVTEVEGSAHPTGTHRFVLDADDPLGEGFLLR